MEKISIKDIVSISGQPGLHRVLRADGRAIVVESLDERKKRQLVRGNMLASKLSDISMYTEDESEPLPAIMQTARTQHPDGLPVNKKSADAELMTFFGGVLPAFDRDRVYASNIRKFVSWMEILYAYDVDFSTEAPSVEEAAAETAE